MYETDDDCVKKLFKFMEEYLEIENPSRDINIHKAHRMGKFGKSKVRPIVAKCVYYPDRERMRNSAGKLKDTNFGISQQFPREIMETKKTYSYYGGYYARVKGRDVLYRSGHIVQQRAITPGTNSYSRRLGIK